MELGSENPARLDWFVAAPAIETFLPESRWREEVLSLSPSEPGKLEIRPDGHRRYWFHRCSVCVQREDGETRDRVYSFVFDWAEGRWQLVDLPAVVS